MAAADFASFGFARQFAMTNMKQTILTAFISACFVVLVVILAAAVAPNTIVHFLGGVSRSEFDEFRELAVVEGVQCYIRQSGTSDPGVMTRIPPNDDAICMRPQGTAANQYWTFTVLRK
jgi:hypothetical protein